MISCHLPLNAPPSRANAVPAPCTLFFMDLLINGQQRSFPQLAAGATLHDLLTALALKADRVAVEHNGSIVSRPAWVSTPIADGDKFEIVHFVGGGHR